LSALSQEASHSSRSLQLARYGIDRDVSEF
jgi:hypothetical protein